MRPIRGVLALGFVVCAAFGATVLHELSKTAIVAEPAAAGGLPPSTLQADGRVVIRPGSQVTVGAELAGKIVRVHAREGQHVRKDELIAELDASEVRGMLREAQGSTLEAYARLKARRAEVRRSNSLVASGALPLLDSARAREEQTAAEGRLAMSDGSARRARALLDKTRIVAPIDGVVLSRFVQSSETVSPGTPLFVIADLSQRRIEAEVDELDIGRVALGAPAEIRAESHSGKVFVGAIDEIASALSARRLRPQDPARPTDPFVLLVKVSLSADSPLKLGQRVTLVVHEASQRQ